MPSEQNKKDSPDSSEPDTDRASEPGPDAAQSDPGDDALDLVEETQAGGRHFVGFSKWAVGALALCWSLFQLALPAFLTLNSDYVRAIHLVFAISLVYLCFPMVKKHRLEGFWSFLSDRSRLPWTDVVLAVVAGLAASYYALNYEQIAERGGLPTAMDLAAGMVLIVVLLEAARRAFGPALSVVALSFIVYGFLGPYLPAPFGFKGVELEQLVYRQTMTSQGIYGTPLRVSARTVFLFVLLGAMLERSGGGRYFVQLAFALLGRYRGGPAKAAVAASGLTGMVSGSSIANVVTTGTFTIPLMKRCGYPPEKAAAIEVAASTNGQLMPPIMGAAAFIIAEYCSLNYLQVVRAAFLPAVVSYLGLFYITHLEAGKLGLKGMARSDLPVFVTVLMGGLHFLAPVIALVWMLLEGFSAQMAAFYAILTLSALVVVHAGVDARRRSQPILPGLVRGGKLLIASLIGGAKGMMAVGVACAAAGIIVGMVGLGPGAKLTEIVASLSGGSVVLILILTALASLILGMGLPTTATYIVMASLTATVIVDLGSQAGLEVPLVAAHLFCFYFGILADDTPPVGLAAYAGAAIAKSHPIRTGVQGFVYDLRTAILPFMFVFNTDLLLWNIHAWWHMGLIFLAATVAMFAFAAATQNFLAVRNRMYETALLLVSAGIILRPGLVGDVMRWAGISPGTGWLGGLLTHRITWYVAGMILFAGLWRLQALRRGAPDEKQ
jgi:TRAP transporter 4TM/12TM fusion protein